jgi:two-component system OmpR family response regulator
VIRALVVDDHESVRVLVGKVLVMLGWDVRTAATGDEALGAAHAATVDVLLTDVSLGDMTGLGLAQRIRARTPAVRVVLMSGHAREELVRQARAEGVPGPGEAGDLVLPKPFGVADIRAMAAIVEGHADAPAGRTSA